MIALIIEVWSRVRRCVEETVLSCRVNLICFLRRWTVGERYTFQMNVVESRDLQSWMGTLLEKAKKPNQIVGEVEVG